MTYGLLFSSARDPLSAFNSPWLPSWHAYSNIPYDGVRVSGNATVHGAVHVCGSSTVAS